MTHTPEFTEALDDMRTEAVRKANLEMRLVFLFADDTRLGERIAKSRKKGSAFASTMMLNWSPIRWVRTDGLAFEISEGDALALGDDADDRVDQIVIQAVEDAIVDPKSGFLGALLRDVVSGLEPSVYEVEHAEDSRSSHG